MQKQNHPYHMIDQSPWPLIMALAGSFLLMNLINLFNKQKTILLLLSLMMTSYLFYLWWKDITRESTFMGLHSQTTMNGLKTGMILFIVSEVLFFFSFFWAFFHSALNPTMDLGLSWPPTNIMSFNPLQIPLLNSIILLTSGLTVTISHHLMIMTKKISEANLFMAMTILLGMYFTMIQAMEYKQATFTIADSIYSSTFFVATGFHGLHVIIGSLFLLFMMLRMMNSHFSSTHHIGLEASIWYWHFVDVVWLFLYISIYWWGSY